MATDGNGLANNLWAAVQALSQETRQQFMAQLVADPTLRHELENLLDLQLAIERMLESTRPLDDVLAEIDR